MATDLCEGVFSQILLKTTENDYFEAMFKNLPLSVSHILRTIGFFIFPPISYLSNLDQKKFGWFRFILSRVMLKKPLGGLSQPLPLPLPFVQEVLTLKSVIFNSGSRENRVLSTINTHAIKSQC